MRAKLRVTNVEQIKSGDTVVAEKVSMCAVCKDGGYPADGSDEDNTFAKWSPSADFTIHINNPNLFGKHAREDRFYVDFHRAIPVDAPAKS